MLEQLTTGGKKSPKRENESPEKERRMRPRFWPSAVDEVPCSVEGGKEAGVTMLSLQCFCHIPGTLQVVLNTGLTQKELGAGGTPIAAKGYDKE